MGVDSLRALATKVRQIFPEAEIEIESSQAPLNLNATYLRKKVIVELRNSTLAVRKNNTEEVFGNAEDALEKNEEILWSCDHPRITRDPILLRDICGDCKINIHSN